MESFRSPIYDPIRIIILLLIIVVSGFFIFKYGFNRNLSNQALVLDIGGTIDDGAVLPGLLASGIDSQFDSFFNTDNQDFYNALSDMGINMLRYLPGVNSNYSHWDGNGLGLTETESEFWNEYNIATHSGGTKSSETNYTTTYDGNPMPATRFYDKFITAVQHLRRPVATYSVNVVTQVGDGIPMQTPIPVDEASIQKAITENINLLTDIKNRGIVLEGVQLCSECSEGAPTATNIDPESGTSSAFSSPSHFVQRVHPIALAIQNFANANGMPNLKIQIHIKKPRIGASDYGASSAWNKCIKGDPTSNDAYCKIGFSDITNLEFGTYLNGDDLENYDDECDPSQHPGINSASCFRDLSREFFDIKMPGALDSYINYFAHKPFRITQYEINNYDQSNIVDEYTTAAFSGTLANAAFDAEYLFKLAQYNSNPAHINAIVSATVTNFGGYPSHVAGKITNGDPKDQRLVTNGEVYNTTGTYSQRPLKLYITGLNFRLIKDVFDGHHRVYNTSFDMTNTNVVSGQLQGYAFQNIQTGAVSYYFVNWSDRNVPISNIKVDGKFIDDPTATATISWIKGETLTSTYGKGDDRNSDTTNVTNNLFVSPDIITGTSNITLAKFSVTKIDGLIPSQFEQNNIAHLTTTIVVINNDGGTKQVSDFLPLSVSGTSVTSGVSTQFNPGTYTATENFDENYVATFSGNCDSGGSVTLSAGDNKSCTITNNDIAQNVTTTTDGSTTATTVDDTTTTTTDGTTDGTSADTTSTTDGSTTATATTADDTTTTTTTTTTTADDTTATNATTATTVSDPTTSSSSSSGGSWVDPTTTTTTTTSTTGVAQDTTGTTTGGTGEVPPAPLPDGGICTPYLTTYIQYGYDNNTDDVTRLQNFLNSHEGESLVVTGTYDSPSFEAVKRFQSKYASSVLTVWGLSSPTGYVYKTTRNKINSFNCNTTIICPAFVGDFVPGETDPEISKIKSLLNDLGFPAGAGEYYDDTMKTAVVDFQETFHKVILDPWGLVDGTAWIHNTTRKYLNDLVGCVTPPADLDGQGTFEY